MAEIKDPPFGWVTRLMCKIGLHYWILDWYGQHHYCLDCKKIRWFHPDAIDAMSELMRKREQKQKG